MAATVPERTLDGRRRRLLELTAQEDRSVLNSIINAFFAGEVRTAIANFTTAAIYLNAESENRPALQLLASAVVLGCGNGLK
jgi:hypothetical protein